MVADRLRAAFERLGSRVVWWGWELVQRLGAIDAGRPRARPFRRFGADSVVCFPVASIVGEDRIEIGAGTVIGPYSTLSAGLPGQPPAEPDDVRLVIGDRCWLGRGTTITAHHRIELGDDIWTGHGIFVSDQNHGWDDPDLPIGRQFSPPQKVVLGDGCWIGHGAVILPGASIGRGAVVGAGAVVTGPVPDRAIAVGVPARVVRIIGEDEDVESIAASVVRRA